jgi:hypothetical protein
MTIHRHHTAPVVLHGLLGFMILVAAGIQTSIPIHSTASSKFTNKAHSIQVGNLDFKA